MNTTLSQMTTTYQSNITDTDYNGWTNYETWNVALWIQNDEGLYNLARLYSSYSALMFTLFEECGLKETPDGVKFNDPKINRIEMNQMLQDL
jgi:hypothetical protein